MIRGLGLRGLGISGVVVIIVASRTVLRDGIQNLKITP